MSCASHGVRVSPAVPTSSIDSPDGSPTTTDSSPNRGGASVTVNPRSRSRFFHASSVPAGTENDVTVTWPAPLMPCGTPRVRYGKVVQSVPGVPRSSP